MALRSGSVQEEDGLSQDERLSLKSMPMGGTDEELVAPHDKVGLHLEPRNDLMAVCRVTLSSLHAACWESLYFFHGTF